jgi:hypothetical protein
MSFSPFRPFVFLLLASILGAVSLRAQEDSEARVHHEHGQVQIPIKHWQAPLYFHPNAEESNFVRRAREEQLQTAENASSPLSQSPSIGDPSAPLVFIAMTPCRLMDTRPGNGQTGAFGPPSLVASAVRTVPIPTHPTCSVPATALAYSLNVTVVPMGELGFLTIWPAGQPQPVVSTLNSPTGQVIANAAIVPAGTMGGVDIFVSNNCDAILDINGYYVAPSSLSLGAGTAVAPSLIFGTDTTSGLYSTGAGTVNIAANGTNIETVNSTGISVVGNVNLSGVLTGNASGLTNLPVRYTSFVPVCDLNIPGALSAIPANLGTIGTFTKVSASSSIVIDWGGHVFAGAVSNVVFFFLAVDGTAAIGNQANGLLFSQDAGVGFVYLPIHAVFTGLAAGSHNVQLWVSIPNGSASNVAENPGCYSESVTVQEL